MRYVAAILTMVLISCSDGSTTGEGASDAGGEDVADVSEWLPDARSYRCDMSCPSEPKATKRECEENRDEKCRATEKCRDRMCSKVAAASPSRVEYEEAYDRCRSGANDYDTYDGLHAVCVDLVRDEGECTSMMKGQSCQSVKIND